VVNLPNQSSVARVNLENPDGFLLRVCLPRGRQGEDAHQRECEHRQKPQ
jgi:hypothetical protein